MVYGMATVKKTLSFDVGAFELAEQAAQRAGVSVSAWMSRVARQEAVRLGAGPESWEDAEGQAILDEEELERARAEGLA
jgi:hypothetical protein